MKENKVQMTLRMPESLFDWSKEEAARIGIPQAALLLSLMDDGRRYKELIQPDLVQKSCLCRPRNHQCS